MRFNVVVVALFTVAGLAVWLPTKSIWTALLTSALLATIGIFIDRNYTPAEQIHTTGIFSLAIFGITGTTGLIYSLIKRQAQR